MCPGSVIVTITWICLQCWQQFLHSTYWVGIDDHLCTILRLSVCDKQLCSDASRSPFQGHITQYPSVTSIDQSNVIVSMTAGWRSTHTSQSQSLKLTFNSHHFLNNSTLCWWANHWQLIGNDRIQRISQHSTNLATNIRTDVPNIFTNPEHHVVNKSRIKGVYMRTCARRNRFPSILSLFGKPLPVITNCLKHISVYSVIAALLNLGMSRARTVSMPHQPVVCLWWICTIFSMYTFCMPQALQMYVECVTATAGGCSSGFARKRLNSI